MWQSKTVLTLAALVIVLLGTNVYAVVLFIEGDKIARANARSLAGATTLLDVEWQGQTRDAVLDKLRVAARHLPKNAGVVWQEKDEIVFDGVHFAFRDEKLVEVR